MLYQSELRQRSGIRAPKLLKHTQGRVARQRTGGHGDRHITGGGAGWNFCLNECVGNHIEVCGDSVKRDICCSREALPKNADNFADLPYSTIESDEWAEANVQAEDGSTIWARGIAPPYVVPYKIPLVA